MALFSLDGFFLFVALAVLAVWMGRKGRGGGDTTAHRLAFWGTVIVLEVSGLLAGAFVGFVAFLFSPDFGFFGEPNSTGTQLFGYLLFLLLVPMSVAGPIWAWWMTRSQNWFVAVCVTPVVVGALLFAGRWVQVDQQKQGKTKAAAAGALLETSPQEVASPQGVPQEVAARVARILDFEAPHIADVGEAQELRRQHERDAFLNAVDAAKPRLARSGLIVQSVSTSTVRGGGILIGLSIATSKARVCIWYLGNSSHHEAVESGECSTSGPRF